MHYASPGLLYFALNTVRLLLIFIPRFTASAYFTSYKILPQLIIPTSFQLNLLAANHKSSSEQNGVISISQ